MAGDWVGRGGSDSGPPVDHPPLVGSTSTRPAQDTRSTPQALASGRASESVDLLPEAPDLIRSLRQVLQAGKATPRELRLAVREAGLLDPYEAERFLESALSLPPGRAREELVRTLLLRLAVSDPVRAMELTAGISGQAERERTMAEVLESWGTLHPFGALEWIEESRDRIPTALYLRRIQAAVAGFAQTNPDGALSYALAIPEDTRSNRRLRDRLVREVLDMQVESGRIEEAKGMIPSLPEGSLRDGAIREFVGSWGRVDPTQAASFLQSVDLSEGEWARATSALVRAWSEIDPAQAAGYVAALPPEDPAFSGSVATLIEQWSRYDLAAPGDWLNEFPPSPEIDRAAALYSMRAAEDDPDAAMSWAQSIEREGLRDRLSVRIGAIWRESDPESFNNFLRSGEIDEALAERIERTEGRSGGWWGDGFGRGSRR